MTFDRPNNQQQQQQQQQLGTPQFGQLRFRSRESYTTLRQRHKVPLQDVTMKSAKLTTTLTIIISIGSLLLVLNFLVLLHMTQQQPQQQHPQAPISVREHCNCIDCREDQLCGGLWRANHFLGMPQDAELYRKKVRIVISHCNKSLDWMKKYTEGFVNIASMHVISKCGVEVQGAPDGAIVQELQNVGREGHSFAYYITSILPKVIASPTEEDAIVVFLKDSVTEKIYQSGDFRRLDFKSLVRLASSENGFGCGTGIVGGSTSAYHDKATLSQFSLSWYGKGETDYKDIKMGEEHNKIPFESSYANLGSFFESLPIKQFLDQEPGIVPVCYAGIFSASVANIYRREMRVWEALQKKLERGDNIQEGHFVERSWARLLSSPLKPYQVEAINSYATGIQRNIFSVHGPLLRAASETDVTYMNLNAYRGDKPPKKQRKMVSIV